MVNEVPDVVKARSAEKLYKADYPNTDYKTVSAELKEAYKELAQSDRARYASEKTLRTKVLLDLLEVYIDSSENITLNYLQGTPSFAEVAPSVEEGRAAQMLRVLALVFRF